MEGRPDLYAAQSADGRGKAFEMVFDGKFKKRGSTRNLDQNLPPRLARFILAFEESMASRYKDWELVRHGGVQFQDETIAEIVFTGQDKTKVGEENRWRRILIMLNPDDRKRFILLGFSAPIGKEKDYREAFQEIEKSWQWK